MKKKLVVISGAGISAESGLATFRNSAQGLWANFKIEDVCTPDAFNKNPTLVNDFYNVRRIEMLNASPNKAHLDLVEAEEDFDVSIITTNVDTLHEKAGSTSVLHLHGQLDKMRSSRESLSSLNDYLLKDHLLTVGKEGIKPQQEASDGCLLRPHVVFFGEDVPNLGKASELVREADIVIVVGTSLEVYPAAGLVHDAKENCTIYYIDPTSEPMYSFACDFINKRATEGVIEALNKERNK